MSAIQQFTISGDSNETVLSALRQHLPGKPSWSAVRKLLRGRRVSIGGVLCVDEARRLTEGEVVTVSDAPVSAPPTDSEVIIRYVDQDLVVVEKPSGMTTLRRVSERNWSWARKNQQPTLDEAVPRLIRAHAAEKNNSRKIHQRLPKLMSIHRIDRDASGLLVFARNKVAQTKIIQQFAEHDAVRKYFALIPGSISDRMIRTQLIRDRGDGLRGSTDRTDIGQHAVTHIRTLRTIGRFSELECRLETGRTNQIRIHLAEQGHPICGDVKYRGPVDCPAISDDSGVHRLALHAAELKFDHPSDGRRMHFETSWPPDMQRFLNRLHVASACDGAKS